MNNRPYKPGNWWWEDNDGDLHVAEFDKDIETMYTDCDGYDFLTVDDFEDLSNFKRWIGKAVQPNDCDSCRWEKSCIDFEPCSICESTCFTEWQPK